MKTISETIAGEQSLSTFADYLDKAGLMAKLQEGAPLTVFAPTDDAFVRMNIGEALKDQQVLVETLTYHLVAGKVSAGEIREMIPGKLTTETGKSLTLEMDEGEAVIDNGKFVTPDIECSNGIIHIIDNVFQPRLSGWYREDLL